MRLCGADILLLQMSGRTCRLSAVLALSVSQTPRFPVDMPRAVSAIAACESHEREA